MHYLVELRPDGAHAEQASRVLLDHDLASRGQLRREGITDRALAKEVAAGTILRLRGGVYASPGCHPDVQRAARVGGRLACASLMRVLGVWILADDSLHVHFQHTPRRPAGVVRHRETLVRTPDLGRVHIVDGLIETAGCLPVAAAVAVLDSARHLQLVDGADLALIRHHNARTRSIVGMSDPRAESGLETLARLLVSDLGLRFVPQVQFRGIGRVDLLVEGWVVVEADGDAYHSDLRQRRADRRRDALLAATGRPVLRFGYEQLVGRPGEVALALIATLDRHPMVKDARRKARSAFLRAQKSGWA